ncbi:MAG TPA: hypothetical protein VE646_08110 [Actinomycetota bacterium]|nr:hypothetical protein [Actinomycetota bacterium]
MRHGLARPLPIVVALVALASAGCGSGSEAGSGSSASPLPSGSLGVVEPAAARSAVEALCSISNDETSDRSAANRIFYDQAHEELHVIAAAAQTTDPDTAATLLQAKEQVESDLAAHELPDDFDSDIAHLVGATQEGLRALGLSAPTCG